MSAPDAMDFQLHARLFGGSLDRTSDLFPSAVIAVLFLLLSGAIAFKWFRTEKVIRPGFLLVGAIGMFANGLSFAIRAGASNTSPRNLALSTILAAQITLLIGVALMIDAVVVVARDMLLLSAVVHDFARQLYTTVLVHVLLIVAVVLGIVGFVQVKTPAVNQPVSNSMNKYRLWSALLQFLVLIVIIMYFGILNVLQYRPWSYEGRLHPTALIRLVVGTVFLWFMWTCALYEFVLIAVTDDSNDLVASKAFFYICTGFFQGVVAVVMAALDWPRYYPFVHSYFALKRAGL